MNKTKIQVQTMKEMLYELNHIKITYTDVGGFTMETQALDKWMKKKEKQIELMEEEFYKKEMNFIERLSCLLGKQYLFVQENEIYYNRYTNKHITKEQAEEWLLDVLYENLEE